jgi:hypothetical protein
MAILNANDVAVQENLGMNPAEWGRQINGSRQLPQTLSRLRRLQQEETFPICNVGPWPHRIERGTVMVFIPGYDPAKDHEKKGCACSDRLPVIRREARIMNEDEYTFFEEDGRKSAWDYIGVGAELHKYNSLVQYGVFVPAGPEPTHEEIQRAKMELNGCIDRLIEEARDAYDKGPAERKGTISDRHLWAARQRGVTEPWVTHQHSEASVKCDSCGRFCPGDVAKCQCGNIINFEIEKRNLIRRKQQEQELAELELEMATAPRKK